MDLNEKLEKLLSLKDKYSYYLDLLDEFKFDKMKYVRSQDKFTESIQRYEELSETDGEDFVQAEAEYVKWKDSAARNYQACLDVKAKGEEAKKQVESLIRELNVVGSRETVGMVIDQMIEQTQKELLCEK